MSTLFSQSTGLVIRGYHIHPELALCVISKKKEKKSWVFFVSIYGKVLEAKVMVWSGNFRHVAQDPGQHSLGEASRRFSS